VVIVLGTYQFSLGTVQGTVKGVPCFDLPPNVCEKPMPNVTIRFQAEIAGVTASTTTGTDGSFSIRLVPGRYRIDVTPPIRNDLLEGPRELTLWPLTDYRMTLVIPSELL
jgi:hypothetical protein